jgi:pimeloyl-ACP methyl ester carboxylesterase
MKILMLHGYAQNSDTFQRKMRRLEERLRTTFPNTEFAWPEGVLQLRVDGIIGHDGEQQQQHNNTLSPDLRAWFHLRYVLDPPHGFFESLDLIAGVLERDGPFDGVVAFSQGTVLAAMVASMLQEKGVRHGAYEEALKKSQNATIMPYPQSFKDLQHPPLKFGILYAGRVGRTSYYDWLYKSPPIDTPFCQFVGMWDPMVDHEERDAVVARLSSNEKSVTIVHTGGHFAPTDDDNNDRVVEFIKRCCCKSGNDSGRGCKAKSSEGGSEKGDSTGARVSPRASRRISLAEWKRGLTVFPQSMMI